MSKIKILVCYHKKAPLFKNEVLVPIFAGKACAFEPSKDGVLPQEEYKWLCSHMIGDDTGGEQNNLSRLNREINEWSVIYWAWKNYEMLGNPDYIGLMHYRRVLDFRGEIKTGDCNYIDALGLKEKYLKEIFGKYEFVYHRGVGRRDKIHFSFDCFMHEAKLSDTYHPILFNEYLKYRDGNRFYNSSIFIMKRKDFFNFCTECIPLMMDVLNLTKSERMEGFIKWLRNNLDKEKFDWYYKIYKENNDYQPRHVGFMMEYISCFYFMHLIDKYKERAFGSKILVTEPPKFIALKRHKIIKMIIKILVSKRKYRKFKRNPKLFFDDSKSNLIRFLGRQYFMIKI